MPAHRVENARSSAARFVAALRAETAEPLSHGKPIEGSILRVAVVCTVLLYSAGLLFFDLGSGEVARAGVVRNLFYVGPVMLGIALVHYLYVRRRPDDRSLARIVLIAVFDNMSGAGFASAGPVFLPLLVLLPWFALVYGVRFGKNWLALSAGLGTACLLTLLVFAEDPTTRPLLIAFTLSLIVVAVYCHRLVGRLKAANESLLAMASTDVLTGIANRRHLMQRIDQESASLRRNLQRGVPADAVGFIMLDIDHFKRVNDTYGHAAGDDCIRITAERIAGDLREYDVVGRYGGEEFLVVLPHTDFAGAMVVAERIRGHVAATTMNTCVGALHITVSAGVSCIGLHQPDTALAVRTADAMLYEAKEAGRNRVMGFDCTRPPPQTGEPVG